MSYKPLGEYGLIGDMRTAALVSRDGSIDWSCFPRFDSPSVFARILDHKRGGFWSIAPTGRFQSSHEYEAGTNVLVTRFDSGSGELLLTDFMPALEWNEQLASHHEIHRRLEARGGPVDIETRFQPRFDYASSRSTFKRRKFGILATDGHDEVLTVATNRPVDWEIGEKATEARASFRLEPGKACWFVLRYDDDEVWPCERYESWKKLKHTRSFWLSWLEGIRYTGPYRSLVERSALTLKMLFYAPTGAIVAAPTTSLPEEIGGVRNWDYRYSWLRDSTFTLFGLDALGKFEELDRYMGFLKKVCRRGDDPLQILFGIGGELELPESELPHLEGYRASSPVRIGNSAADQFQLDVYGEVMDAIHIWRRRYDMTEGIWELCKRLADGAMRLWREPDAGVWELRGRRHHFVFSKVMCWVAMNRAIRLVEELGIDFDVSEWRSCQDEIRLDVLERGWNEGRQTFVQHYDTDRTDAANIVLSIVRFLPHNDPRVLATLDRIREELGHPSGLLYRYRTPDGLPGGEGAFCVITFQMAQALALAGRHEQAEELFETVIGYASPLGLFSEEIDPDTGELLGNYPQAFSHIGLINAAHVLARTRPGSAADYALLEELPDRRRWRSGAGPHGPGTADTPASTSRD